MKRFVLALSAMLLCFGAAQAADTALHAAVAGPQRTPANAARDAARHPEATLAFLSLIHI